MPHTQIVFVKIKMELLEDDRFLFDLTDTQKGLYLLLLALAGKTRNKIRNNAEFIKGRLALKSFDIKDLHAISDIFKKFKLLGDYWVFTDFEEQHNYYYPTKGNTSVLPKSYENKKENKNKNEKEKENKNPTSVSFTEPQERLIKQTLVSKNHHSLDSEANKVAFSELSKSVLADKTVKSKTGVAIYRAKKGTI